MPFTVEFLTLPDADAPPAAVDRINGRFTSLAEARSEAMVLFSTMQSVHGAVGFRVLDESEAEVAVEMPGAERAPEPAPVRVPNRPRPGSARTAAGRGRPR